MQIQRRFVRWQIDHPAKVKLEGAEAYMQCQVKNISLKGFQMALGLKLEEDKFWKMHLMLREGLVLEVEAWIVWHKILGSVNIYGFYFTRIKDNDKEEIYRFIRSNFSRELNKQWWEGVDAQTPDLRGKVGVPLSVEGGEKMQDRRVFDRFSIKFPLRFLNPRSGGEALVQARDISAKGIGFEADEELAGRTFLEMWLAVPDKGEPLYMRGEVVWSEKLAPQRCKVGVNLERANLMGLARVLRVKNP